MASAAHTGGDIIGGLLGGVVGAIGGFLVGGPGGAIAGAIGGGIEGVNIAEGLMTTIDTTAQTKATIGDFSKPATTGPTAPIATPDNPGGTPTPTSPWTTQIDPYATDEPGIARERAAEAELQINQSQEQLGQQILGMKSAETMAEGGIKASTAARGLKMEGSPLMALLVQEQYGQQTEGFTERQGAASIAGMGIARQSAYDAAALVGKEELQYADQQMSNAWLTAFTSVINFGTGMMSNFWNPATAGAKSSDYGAFSSPYNYGSSPPGFGGGFGYG